MKAEILAPVTAHHPVESVSSAFPAALISGMLNCFLISMLYARVWSASLPWCPFFCMYLKVCVTKRHTGVFYLLAHPADYGCTRVKSGPGSLSPTAVEPSALGHVSLLSPDHQDGAELRVMQPRHVLVPMGDASVTVCVVMCYATTLAPLEELFLQMRAVSRTVRHKLSSLRLGRKFNSFRRASGRQWATSSLVFL